MTRTLKTSRKIFQLSAICAVFVVAGLVAAATTASAATRVNETRLNWSKQQFINFCNSKRQEIVCKLSPYKCSCDDGEYRYIQGPGGIVRVKFPPPTFVPETLYGQGNSDGGGGRGGGTKGGR